MLNYPYGTHNDKHVARAYEHLVEAAHKLRAAGHSELAAQLPALALTDTPPMRPLVVWRGQGLIDKWRAYSLSKQVKKVRTALNALR